MTLILAVVRGTQALLGAIRFVDQQLWKTSVVFVMEMGFLPTLVIVTAILIKAAAVEKLASMKVTIDCVYMKTRNTVLPTNQLD